MMPEDKHRYDIALLKNAGLYRIAILFQYYGFNLTSNLSETKWHKIINTKHACINVCVGIITWITYSQFVYAAKVSSLKKTVDEYDGIFYLWLISNFGCFALDLQIIISYCMAKYIRTLVWSLARAIDKVTNQKNKNSCKKIIEVWTCLIIIAMVAGAIIAGIIMIYSNEADIISKPYKETWSGSIYFHGIEIGIAIWGLIILTFYILYTGLILTVCHLLSKLIDIFAKDANDQSGLADEIFVWDNARKKLNPSDLINRYKTHRNLSLLVAVCDKMFNFYMLNSLILETSVSIVALKLMHIQNDIYFINGLFQTTQLILLTLKAMMCATVNDKVNRIRN
ncbi:hypothetical protein CHUAL_003557 [Chamberlinius hualienensis]